MNKKDIRGKAYNKALERLMRDGHVMFAWGHTEEHNGAEVDITDSYVLDSYGNRYMATHYPDFSKHLDIIKGDK